MATETERFAELMRGFKERSGRSYGTLAKRLHSSNSTLHRYCSGAAVPTEYAPVERFARVCGASADELLALHQQWLLALVERRRGVPEEQASGSGSGEANSAAPEVPPASAVVTGVAEEASDVRAQVETGDPAPDPMAPSGSAPVALPAPAPAAEAPADLVRSGPARASGPGARRPRLLLAVAAAVATAAVAGTAAAVSAMGGTGQGDTRHGAAVQSSSREQAAGGPAVPSGGSSGGSSSPTPGADSAAPSSPGPSSPSAASVSASPADSKEGASPTAPFTVNVLPDNWDSPCDQWFALDKAPGTVPPPPAGQATDGWARALDAVPAGHLRMQLTVQGTEGKAAVLHALYVHVVSGRKAPGWNAYTMGSGCGGALVPASFAVDLDDASPRARPVPGKEGERTTASTDFPYKVSATDPQVLNVDAATLGKDVSWYLELAWSSGDRRGTTRIDDHGRPFRTVALNAGHGYWYNENKNSWLLYED
ncbi:helix-turn-helix transcriptional regulator [Streptomyces sp. NPDC002812]|uniref:helix-turn-helix domain-containing protein n=1 Tax=Streptomyces sp. NPDC002812 TaxID=3154434 RepID=UPI003325A339